MALKYAGEEEYSYLVAPDLSLRHIDIVQLCSLRWLVEFFIQDQKAHGGWNRMSKQQGKEGSMRGVILSLLCDHVLLLHPEQSARLKSKQPRLLAGCLIERLNTDCKATVRIGEFSRGDLSRGNNKALDHDFGDKDAHTPCGIVNKDPSQLYLNMSSS